MPACRKERRRRRKMSICFGISRRRLRAAGSPTSAPRMRRNGVLVVTEGLFSMDSDTPDIAALAELCHEYNATLMVDVAHDLGCIGEDGRGHIGLQKMLGKVDIVMGS